MKTTTNKAATTAAPDQEAAQLLDAAPGDVISRTHPVQQQEYQHSAPATRTSVPISRQQVRGTSLGYAAAHLGSGSVAGLGAIGSNFGWGGVALAGGIAAGSAVAGYTARRVRRSRRAAAGSTTLARSASVRRGGRGDGLLGRGSNKKVKDRKTAARRATAGARPHGRQGLLHGRKGHGLLGSRSPSSARRRPAGLLGTSRRAGVGSGPGRKCLLNGKRTNGNNKGLFATTSRAGRKTLSDGKGHSTSKKGTSSNGHSWKSKGWKSKGWKSKGWKSWSGSETNKGGGKGKDGKKNTMDSGETSGKGTAAHPPQFVEETDSNRPAQHQDKQIPDSRRERGTSTGGGRTMGHVAESVDTLVTAIAKADIGSARKLDAVFEDLAMTEAKLAQAKRLLAARIAEEFPADTIVSDHVHQSAALQVRLSNGLTELRTVFRRAHAKEWERLEAPRRNEQAWDITHNQE